MISSVLPTTGLILNIKRFVAILSLKTRFLGIVMESYSEEKCESGQKNKVHSKQFAKYMLESLERLEPSLITLRHFVINVTLHVI